MDRCGRVFSRAEDIAWRVMALTSPERSGSVIDVPPLRRVN
jgi:hypothetical protein